MMEPGGGTVERLCGAELPPAATALPVAAAFAAVSLASSFCATRSPPAASFAVVALDSVASLRAATAVVTAFAAVAAVDAPAVAAVAGFAGAVTRPWEGVGGGGGGAADTDEIDMSLLLDMTLIRSSR